MLNEFPESLLAFAVDGVIPPSARGQAARADQIGTMARRRASAELGKAMEQAEQIRIEAGLAGYTDGYVDALSTAMPHLVATLDTVHRLRGQMLADLHQILAATFSDAEVLAGIVLQRLEQECAEREDGQGVILHVPESQQALGDALLARLAGRADLAHVSVTRTRADLLLLQCGALVFELDPVERMHGAIERMVAPDVLEAAARQRADAYVDVLRRVLASTASRADIHVAEVKE